MNKKEVIKELQKQAIHHCGEIECYKDGCKKSVELSKAINIISQIDEPQKVVIPKFVGEWIETHKRWMPFLSHLFTDNLDEELKEWLDFSDNQNLMAKAWLYGYEVEKEKLYTVEIPDPNSYAYYRYLSRNDNGICIDASNDAKWKQKKRNQLTESEIKQDFDFLWQFAKEVE